MKTLWLALSVLRRGHALQNPGTWKTVSAATTAIAVVLPDTLKLLCEMSGVCIDLSPGELNQVATSIANVGVGVFILYTIFGTSEKVGV